MMLQKSKTIKTKKTSADLLSDSAQQIGILLMTLAATIGMVELPDHLNSKIITPSQPAFAYATSGNDQNPLRREREESAPHYISYSESQRTPGRTREV